MIFILEEIGRDNDNNLLMERRNGKGARVMGINLEAKAVYSWMQIQAGATIQRSRYKEPESWSENEESGTSEKDVPFAGCIWLFHFFIYPGEAVDGFVDRYLYR